MEKKSLTKQILDFSLTKIFIGNFVCFGIYILSQYLLFEVAVKFRGLSKDFQVLFVSVVSSIIVLFVYIFLFKKYENRSITEFSFNKIGFNLGTGILLGVLIPSLTILIIYSNNGYSVASINAVWSIVSPLKMAFSTAIILEILLRGITFRIIEEKLGSYIALIISALMLGLFHFLNPNSTVAMATGLSIQAGLLLGAAYMYSRNLWFPIAIHFGWRFIQSVIADATLSGDKISEMLMASKIEGFDWFTGFTFGPEGSIQAILFNVSVFLVLVYLCKKQGKIIKPYWTKK